jgi:hypothetical protein
VTRRFFDAGTITFETEPFVFVRYLNESDEEGFRSWPSVHFRRIEPPFSGCYTVSEQSRMDRFVEMDGLEEGLLLPMDRGPGEVSFWQVQQGISGYIRPPGRPGLTISEGETIVDHPRFVRATQQFTSPLTPYHMGRIFFRLMACVFILRVEVD